MRKKKGCPVSTCVSNEKKRFYKEKEQFCSMCGTPLILVCKHCYAPLPEDAAEPFCIDCQTQKKKKPKKQKAKKTKQSGKQIPEQQAVIKPAPKASAPAETAASTEKKAPAAKPAKKAPTAAAPKNQSEEKAPKAAEPEKKPAAKAPAKPKTTKPTAKKPAKKPAAAKVPAEEEK